MNTQEKPRLQAVKPRGEFKKPAYRKAEGHEVPLASAIRNGTVMEIILMNGNVMETRVLGFDKFTVTVENKHGRPHTFFKHSIMSFCERV